MKARILALKCHRECASSNNLPSPSPFAGRVGEGASTLTRSNHPSLILPVEGRESEESSLMVPRRSGRQRVRSAFTLLEVILSLAILAGALAALGEVMRLAERSASAAEDETQAQILAASVMDELQAGSRELNAVSQSALETGDDPPWVFSVDIEQTQYDELVAVKVRVEQQMEARLQPASFELTRWLPNPNYVPPSTDDGTNTSSTTGTSSGTSGSSTTGSSSGGTSK